MPTARCRAALVVLAGMFALVAPAAAQLPPGEELKTLRSAPQLDVALFASEPLVTNPAAIDVDTHGRVWVAEIQWYRGGAKDPPSDKIKVLEDTDGDGRADRATVFADHVFAPMSICVAGARVYVATSPDLWVYEDADGDLRADGPPRKLLSGFGGRNHDHGAHSLTLGPDHKWWMSHGDAGFDVTGPDGSRVRYQWGAVLRGELDGTRLETVAVNFRNPYEVCVDSFGEAFLSDNDNDGNESVRICWIMEGGNYGWFGGPPFGKQELAARLAPGTPFREHWHFRGHLPGFVPATLVTGFGSPCGICIHESDSLGPKFRNAALHADAGPRECRVYRHQPAGFGMKATSEVFLSNSGDDYFRPDDVCVAPDGRLYVADWYDGGVGGHAYNNPDQGRIFVLSPRDQKPTRREKPGPYDNTADAAAALCSPNLATQFLAREKLLADGDASVPALETLLADPDPNRRARALWVLDRLGGAARQKVVDQLAAPEPAFRALAVRILRRHGDAHAAALLALAGDASEQVRREVLLAIRNLNNDAALDALARIAASYDGRDRYQLEAIHIAAGDRRDALLARLETRAALTDAQFPLLQLLAPQRAADVVLARLGSRDLDDATAQTLLAAAADIPSPAAGWGLVNVAADSARAAELRRAALARVVANAGPRGNWSKLASDPRLAAALDELLDDEALRGSALSAIDALRLRRLAPAVLAVAQNHELSTDDRRHAVALCAKLKPRGAVAALRALVEDPQPAVANAALVALVDLQDAHSLRELFARDSLPADTRRAAAERAADTTAGAIVLFRLIEANHCSGDIKDAVIAKAVRHPDANVRVLYEKFIPEGQRSKKLGQSISADQILALAGDANRGRVIFFQSTAAACKQCHAVQGFGGATGPDLSHIGKKYERRALLETILEPSKAIAPEYIPYVLETTAGQVYAGFLTARTDAAVELRDVENRTIRVAAGDVEALLPQTKSLMPELVLSEVTAQDAADLLAFLTSLK